MSEALDRKQVVSWALYDWGNSAFATTVMAGFFPILFGNYWHAGGVASGVITSRLGYANAAASIVVCLLAPLLGAVADISGSRKRLLALFSMLGITMTIALYWVAQGQWLIAACIYAVANIGFSGANIFYDALLVDVAPRRRDAVSALGYSLGYLGGGLLFAVNVWMVTSPETFGLTEKSHAARIAFLSVGIWWLVFMLPLLFFVKEKEATDKISLAAATAGMRSVWKTLRDIRHFRPVFIFLVAYWLYIDGVNTVIRMAVNYGQSLGFADDHLIIALLITQFVGFPAAIAYGYCGEKIGTRKALLFGIFAYIGATVYAVFMDNVSEFYVLAVVVGLVQGGVQALSRSYFSRLIPQDRAGEFFGFYNMLGKFAGVLGPLLMGITAAFLGTRLSILSLVLLFLFGGFLLTRVREPHEYSTAAEAPHDDAP